LFSNRCSIKPVLSGPSPQRTTIMVLFTLSLCLPTQTSLAQSAAAREWLKDLTPDRRRWDRRTDDTMAAKGRSMSLEKIPEVLRALADERVDYVLIGAVAMMAHGLVRATEDLDFFVRPDADNIGRLRAALRRVFPDDPAIDEISHEDLVGDYPAVRYNTPDESFGIDILARLGEAFAYDEMQFQEQVFDGIPVRVATPAMLYRMKKATVRWKDRIDAQQLRDRFGLED
ncbi:MAG TPA: nucleotidyl transferase AbiEii/AbiGii toxin family protein, partial [Terriglobia bacterium]|nr:nucleotidyl transferase AbiEii/AbiGii toxin family protein [Terriglobia bacterium]